MTGTTSHGSLLVLLSAVTTLASQPGAADGISPGEWRITEMTGEIRTVASSGAGCDQGQAPAARPVGADDEEHFLRFDDEGNAYFSVGFEQPDSEPGYYFHLRTGASRDSEALAELRAEAMAVIDVVNSTVFDLNSLWTALKLGTGRESGGWYYPNGRFEAYELMSQDMFGMVGRSVFYIDGQADGGAISGDWYFKAYGDSMFCKQSDHGAGKFRAVPAG